MALAATAVVAPMFFLGNASGHDFQFHLASWMDVAGQWREGILYPRWAEWANWGFGEPRFIFYPPASWMLGAALGSVLPWRRVPGAYIWLTLIVAGMSMWKLAREWLPGASGRSRGFLRGESLQSGDRLLPQRFCGASGGGACFPLLLWAALRVIRGEWRRVPHLGGGLRSDLALERAGGRHRHLLAGVCCWSSAALRQRSLRPLLLGATAMVAGFGLAAFYILPAAWERRWVQIAQAARDESAARSRIFFSRTRAIPNFVLFNWKVSGVALGMMLVTGVAARALRRDRRREFGEIWWMLLALGIASAFVMFPPERSAVAPSAGIGVSCNFRGVAWAAGGRLCIFRGRGDRCLAAALAVGGSRRSLVLAAIAITGTADRERAPGGTARTLRCCGEIRSGHGYEGTDEYAAAGIDRYESAGTPRRTRTKCPMYRATPRVEEFDAASGTARARRRAMRDSRRAMDRASESVSPSRRAEPVTLALRLVELSGVGSASRWQRRARRRRAG